MTKKKPKSFFAYFTGKSIWFGSKDFSEKKIYLGTNEKKARRKFNKLALQYLNTEKVLND